MAWNGSTNGGADAVEKGKNASIRGKRTSAFRGILAGAVIVFGGAAVLVYFTRPSENAGESVERKHGAIDVVEPVIAPKPQPVAAKPDPNARPTKVGEKLNGYILLPSGKMHKIKGEIHNDRAATHKADYAIFDFACENEIAAFLTIQRGDTLIGTPHYNGRFKAEFLESLKHPIIPDDDDSEDVKLLKRAVTDVKIKLKEALDNGEDIEQMMHDEREKLQEFYRYKTELRGKLTDISHWDGLTIQNMDDYVNSANKMLESKGIAPIEFGPLVRRKLQLESEMSRSRE